MRMLLATADPDLRLSLELLFDEQPGVQVVGTASEGDSLRALMHTSRSQLILADWDLPGLPLPVVIAEAHQIQPPIATIVMVNSSEGVEPARASGADATILKGTPPDHLLTVFWRLQRQILSSKETNEYE
jgi:DNA-binding NarL/FixJ family response regulator